ncbi:MAG TPA: hypothetical protein VM305_08460 [Candidatus Limnocylindrales bacterium]|nr:hypothetical protein [Candidatus Limnocylindrales bacterium]
MAGDEHVSTDTIRLHYTYGIGLLCLIGSFVLLLLDTPGVEGTAKLALVTTVLGIVLGFIFSRESSVGGARAAERAIQQGAEAASAAPATPGQRAP